MHQPALLLALAAICSIGFADMYSYSMSHSLGKYWPKKILAT
jgi:hypothetical protein